MTATAEPPAAAIEAPRTVPIDRAEGVELLGAVHGSGYKDGAALVRRADGQMVQLGPLMYALLDAVDGHRDQAQIAAAMSERLGRRVDEEHVAALAEKLRGQGLLAGSEHRAPPRRNPLLALRWKVLVTNPEVTRRLTAPLTFLFRPWLMWPIVAAFVAVFWFVLVHKGVASATAQAFDRPGLLLLVFALAVASAGFHELGHAAACRYGGATPGGMGAGVYLVWPAFYTDVTDAYRLPRRARLRVDLGGLYFNAVIAVLTMAVWLAVRADALLLLVALQVLQMVKQLSPVIRSDGYHILSDATGVPDLYAHIGPTLRRLLPRHRREPSALSGSARALVTVWVLIVVPVLLSLMLGAIILLPRLMTSAWDSGHHVLAAIPPDANHGRILDVLSALVRLLALCLPVLGSVLVTQRVLRGSVGKARAWSRGNPARRTLVLAGAAAAVGLMAWAWWPSGQYQPVRANQGGTIGGLIRLVSAPVTVARPAAATPVVQLTPGTHLAVAMIPVGGASKSHPALFVIAGAKGKPAAAVLSPGGGAGGGTQATAPGTSTGGAPSSQTVGTAFPFTLPAPPGPGGTQAVAVGTRNGGVTYDVAYALVTVTGGAPVTETNSAYALAHCSACTTVAVSFQVVLVVGTSKLIAPIDAAGALNSGCPACVTTAIADQLVVTLKSQPSAQLLAKLNAALRQLNALPLLGAGGTPAAIAAAVATVQQQIESQLNGSGLVANTPSTATVPSSSATSTTSTSSSSSPAATTPSPASPSGTTTGSAPGSTGATGTSGSATTTTPRRLPRPARRPRRARRPARARRPPASSAARRQAAPDAPVFGSLGANLIRAGVKMRSLLNWVSRHRGAALLVLMAEVSAAVFVALSGPGTALTLPPLPANDLQQLIGLIPGAQTPAQAPVQENAEPPLTAVPRAVCGPGSHPLAGMQGRVPASATSSPQARYGWTCNATLVSHQGSSGGFKVWRYTDRHGHVCAFYDTALLYPLNAVSLTGPPSTGVAVLDMSDPAHPVQTATLTTLPMLSPHESLNLNAARGLLAADLGNPASYPGLMSIYDVGQDCRHPVLDSTYLAARFGHESGFSPDGRTFWITGGGEGIAAVDVSDPKHPHTIWQGNEFSHGVNLNDAGTRLYVADSVDGNLAILDVSQIQERKPNPQVKEISRLTWKTVTIPQNSAPMQIGGHHYLLEFDEYAFRFSQLAAADTVGAARIINIDDEAHPYVVSNIRLEVNQPAQHHAADTDPGALSPAQGYAAHYCAIPREVDPQIVACSFINSGLRVFNIQDPLHPREVAYFISPPKPADTNGFDASDFAMSKPAFDVARHDVWYTDGTTGFYVVHLDNGAWPVPAPSSHSQPGRSRHKRKRPARFILTLR